jgi:tRNA dimethylallyltransferase
VSSDSTRGRPVIAVVGPTASGKTALAEALAIETRGEIVSADSMQVYRGMDIGTSKPPEPRAVPYHCLDLVDPGVPYSAARYQQDARCAIEDVLARSATPIVAGGTGLYVRAALDDWEIPGGHMQTACRARLERELDEHGAAEMHRRLAVADPQGARLIHPNNSRRVIRALEMIEQGTLYSEQARRFRERRAFYPTKYVGLSVDRARLYERIDRRVEQMLESGLLDEVASLLQRGYRKAVTARQAIGYKEFVPVLEGDRPLEEAAEEVKRSTRRYAKRQMTWFRADDRVRWLDATAADVDALVEQALRLLETDA